jgi:hypothetical protein
MMEGRGLNCTAPWPCGSRSGPLKNTRKTRWWDCLTSSVGRPVRCRGSRGERLRRPRKSQTWAAAFKATGPLPRGSQWIYIADRESDFYGPLQICRQHGVDFVIRACQDRRLAPEAGRLCPPLPQAPVLGRCTVRCGRAGASRRHNRRGTAECARGFGRTLAFGRLATAVVRGGRGGGQRGGCTGRRPGTTTLDFVDLVAGRDSSGSATRSSGVIRHAGGLKSITKRSGSEPEWSKVNWNERIGWSRSLLYWPWWRAIVKHQDAGVQSVEVLLTGQAFWPGDAGLAGEKAGEATWRLNQSQRDHSDGAAGGVSGPQA